MAEVDELLNFAIDLARAAGEVTLRYFQRLDRADEKPDRTPVTIADREAEALLRRRIAARFPRDEIVGEEEGVQPGTSGRRWILDPIDGTVSFVHGVPLYAVLIGLEFDGETQVGVAHFPALTETAWAARGRGCLWNGKPARVSGAAKLDEALVVMTDAARPGGRLIDAARRVLARARVRRGWSDAYGHLLVATGRADVMLDPEMSVWDCAALAPIVEEAGGTFTSWSGERTIRAGNGFSTNGALFDAVMHEIGAG